MAQLEFNQAGAILPEINPNLENKELVDGEEAYHATKNLAHYSSLKNLIKSPHAYYWYMKNPKTRTKSMHLGTLAHKAILEGRDFMEGYIVEPVHKGFTKDGIETINANAHSVKQAKKDWFEQIGQFKKIVTQSEYDDIGFMMESLVSHKFVQEVFKEGRTEVRGQFLDKVSNIGCAFANDFLSFDQSIWVDLKTCQDSSDFAFRRSVEQLRYDLQAAIYLKGTELVFGKRPNMPVWIAIESNPPYECRVHFVDEFYQESGAYEFRNCMSKLKHSLVSNTWAQGQAMIEAIEPTAWFRNYYELRLNEGE